MNTSQNSQLNAANNSNNKSNRRKTKNSNKRGLNSPDDPNGQNKKHKDSDDEKDELITNQQLLKLVKLLQQQVATLIRDNTELKEQMTSLQSQLTTHKVETSETINTQQNDADEENADLSSVAAGMNTIFSQIGTVKDTLTFQTNVMASFAAKSDHNEESIAALQSANNFLEQSRLNDRIEISGLADLAASTNKSEYRCLILKLFREWKIELEKIEIADAYSITRKDREGRDKSFVIVVFIHEAVKNRIMSAKMNSKMPQLKKIYFNDVLTHHNRSLLYEARQRRNAGQFTKVGTINGKPFVKKSLNGLKIYIQNVTELEGIAKLSQENLASNSVLNNND